MMSSISGGFAKGSSSSIQFGAIPDIRRNLLKAAWYQQLGIEFQNKAFRSGMRGDGWGRSAADLYQGEARTASIRSNTMLEAVVSDLQILEYLRHCGRYNRQPITVQLATEEVIQAGSEPAWGTRQPFKFTLEERTPVNQSLADFFSPKNPLMAGKTPEKIAHFAYVLSIHLGTMLDNLTSLEPAKRDQLLTNFRDSLDINT